MRRALLILAAMAMPTVLAAQPAELPPQDYAAQSYVDSAGCAFQRAQIGSRVIWGPRLDAGGQPVCGLEPSLGPPGESEVLRVIPPNRRDRAPAFPEAGNYVQVGAFGRPENADRVTQRLQEAGLSVLRQDFPRRGGVLRVLYAGPLGDAEATAAALSDVRKMGFGDAFIWQQRP